MADATKTITIQGILVEVSTPYAEGHTCSQAEAAALNQVRAENIANNKRKELKELLEANEGDMEAVKTAAQEIVSNYDAEYEFTLASVGGGSTARLDPLTKECRAIAKAHIAKKLREMGVTQKEYLAANGEDAIKSKIAEIENHPKIVEAAQKALAERAALGAIDL